MPEGGQWFRGGSRKTVRKIQKESRRQMAEVYIHSRCLHQTGSPTFKPLCFLVSSAGEHPASLARHPGWSFCQSWPSHKLHSLGLLTSLNHFLLTPPPHPQWCRLSPWTLEAQPCLPGPVMTSIWIRHGLHLCLTGPTSQTLLTCLTTEHIPDA